MKKSELRQIIREILTEDEKKDVYKMGAKEREAFIIKQMKKDKKNFDKKDKPYKFKEPPGWNKMSQKAKQDHIVTMMKKEKAEWEKKNPNRTEGMLKKSELRQIIREEIQSLFKNNGRLTPYLSEEDFASKWKTDAFKKPINDVDNDPLDEDLDEDLV